MKTVFLSFIVSSLTFLLIADNVSGAHSDKMMLKDLQVLTLKTGRMTTGRRSSPVQQLKCIGNCNSKLPNTVQCTNRGWDGTSIQWECKGDFEAGMRFGDLEVICEGYDYPDDPYILTGSCGLEYTVDGSKSSGYEGKPQSYGWQENVLNHKTSKTSGSNVESFIFLLVLAGIVYALYKTCLSGNNEDPSTARSTTNNDYPPDDRRRQAPNMGWNVPGMGGGLGGYAGDDATCGAGAGGRARGAGGGGFWTGMAAGGLMGYMFGNRGGNQRQYYGGAPNTGSSFFSSQPSFGSSSFGSSSTSSTGFGGTRRR